ncbi:Uncharacterised protein [Serratia plymuthica]|nr:Uncharacterised protein [Serratia plymuthica]
MLLAADVQLALNAVQSPRQRAVGVAAPMMVRLLHHKAFAQRLRHVQPRRQILILHFYRLRRPPGDLRVFCRHHRDHLPNVLDPLLRQQRIAVGQRRNIQFPRHVLPGDHPHHAGEGVTGRQIQLDDARMRPLAQLCRQMQLVWELQPIVNVLRLAADVFVGAFMFAAAAYPGG